MAKQPKELTPVVELVPVVEKPKYAAKMTKVIGNGAAPSEQLLTSVPNVSVRPGTARSAALTAIMDSMGQPKPAVLAAVAAAERAWHQEQGRAPKNVNPTGWLRTFKVKFS